MANLSQIEILVSELERLFVSLNEGLRTGTAEDGLTEVKVAKALLADSAKLLLSQDGTSSKNLDQITSDIKSFIEAIEVDPDNANKHTKISAYLEGKFFRKVVDAAYAKAVGDAEDTDTIINTFKELQEVIGATDSLTTVFYQNQMQGHLHLPPSGATSFYGRGGGGILRADAANIANSHWWATGNPTTDGTNGTPRTGTQTRQDTYSAIYYMRYK